MKNYRFPFDIERQIDAATPSLLCGQKELELLKREINKPFDFFGEIQRITQAYCEINGLPVRAPHGEKEWKEYGEKNPSW